MSIYYGLIIFTFFLMVIVFPKRVKINELGNSLSKSEKIYFTLFAVVLVAIAANRGITVGTDLLNYNAFFTEVNQKVILNINEFPFELGYTLLNQLISWITGDFRTVLLVVILVFLLGFYRLASTLSYQIGLSCFMLVTLDFYTSSFNIIRQYLAIGIIFIAIPYLLNNKKAKYILLILFATSFHMTAGIMLLAIPLYKIKFNRKFVAISIIVTLLAFLFVPRIVSLASIVIPKFSFYTTMRYFTGGFRIFSFFNFIFFTVLLSGSRIVINKYSKTATLPRYYDLFSYLLLIGCEILFLSNRFILFDRVANYFTIFSIFLVPNTICLIKNKQIRVLIQFLFIILCFAYFFLVYTLKPESNGINPYIFWR
ncbi:EpsG family protein [Enterococcus faecium]|uniref:EpsG family protein n=1 Tax=Enterococcus faecium TaxID=1352 RepID=UPI000F4E5B2D|nr:EpsG family protein [Enterococcus faecium]ROY96291.1 EpsG family protein [Enterococcus faecium]ROY97270.1 EpsG family protein [Enterococcus faecium]